MDELLRWLREQNSGIITFSVYQQRAVALGETDQANSAHYSLLSALAGHFISSYNGVPLSADVATRAYIRLVSHTEEAQKSMGGSASGKLAFLNRVAAAEL